MTRIWQTPDGHIRLTTFVGDADAAWAKMIRDGLVPDGSIVLAEGDATTMWALLPSTRSRRSAWRWNGSRVVDEPA